MFNDKLNQDGNVLGRIGALAVIVATVVGLGRVCGVSTGMCPLYSGGHCIFESSSK